MKILILGGTWFIGRELTKQLQNTKHEVIHFNRGNTPILEVELIQGDRFANDTDGLCGKSFDIVIDLTCFSAEHFSNTFRYLRGHFKKYIFVSSTSAKIKNGEFGNGKAEAEQVVKRLANYIILRLSNVVGKNDYSNRFYYKNNRWYQRKNNAQISVSSYIEVKKLVSEIIKLIESDKVNKTYLINQRIGLMEVYQ